MTTDSQLAGRPPTPSLGQLCLVFAGIALSGFGGVLPFARRTLVEQRKWMTPEEFNDAFALCQMLPGPNIVNMAVVFGARMHGWLGGFVAFIGFMGPPFVVVIALASLYANVSDNPALQRVMTGISAVGVGLFAATALKMAMPLAKERSFIAWAVVAAVFAAIGILRLPMPLVLAVMIPLSIGLVWLGGRR